MRMSQLFGVTLRKPPAEADTPGYGYLLRAGYVRAVAPGIYAHLPLGLRSLRKIEAVLREEMNGLGGQEVAMPFVQPHAIWERSGRLSQVGKELVRCQDRGGRELIIGMTHEEVVAELARANVRSYRDLPVVLFQIRPAFRDEARPRGGLLRAREFTLLASYSLDCDAAGLAARYDAHRAALQRIFARLGLEDVRTVGGEGGGGEADGEELVLLTDTGDDHVAICASCGYAANQRAARIGKTQPVVEPPLALEEVATPGTDTIASLAEFLGVPEERTAKVVFFEATLPTATGSERRTREIVLIALARGDMEVNEAKLSRAVGAIELRPAEAAAIRGVGAEPGYASPVGLESEGMIVVADDLVAASPNLVSGANLEGYHHRNVNYGRDYEADVVMDIAAAVAGAPCPECGARLDVETSIELGSLHRFESSFTSGLEATYQDEDGAVRPLAMGSYGIGVERLLGCLAETHHDDRGLQLPPAVAPFHIYLAAITGGDSSLASQADAVYSALCDAGVDVLYDDRDASPGVKFNDADLIGILLRATLGSRSLEAGGLELKRREEGEKQIVPLDDAVEEIVKLTASLDAGNEKSAN
jgi:prolyl-tRNA synthetase